MKLTRRNIFAASWITLVVSLALLFAVVDGCKRSTPAAHAGKHGGTLVIATGGAGDDCTKPLCDYLATNYPDLTVVYSATPDGWKDDPSTIAADYAYDRLVLVAHSWGTDTAAQATFKTHVTLAILFDPVAQSGDRISINADRTIVFSRTDVVGPWRAKVFGDGVERYTLPGGHSDGVVSMRAFVAVGGEIARLK